jgi:hypothetical protein
MAVTQEQIDALEMAINQGAVSVEYGDKKVTYRSISDMESILRKMKIEIGTQNKSTRFYAEHSNGLNF